MEQAGKSNVVALRDETKEPHRAFTLGDGMAAASAVFRYAGWCWLVGIWGVLFIGEPDIADAIIHVLTR